MAAPGCIMMYGGMTGTIPTGWLSCDGSDVSRSTYIGLFNSIGTIYGAGDNVTTFNLPNLQGRVPVGPGTAVGAAGATAKILSQTGGEETHTLSAAEIPPHTHSFFQYLFGGGSNIQTLFGNGGTPSVNTTDNGAGLLGLPHNNLQPFIVLNYIIKT
jgi:microcystin-dependent protein